MPIAQDRNTASLAGLLELLAAGLELEPARAKVEKGILGLQAGGALGFAQAVKLMVQSGYCGSYLAVVEPGTLCAGDPIALIPGPREVNLRELFRARMAGRRNLA